MKKILSLALAALMSVSVMAGCRGAGTPVATPQPEPAVVTDSGSESTPEPAGEQSTPVAADYKIGIMTGTVSQGEEEFRAAENMKKKYGDIIVTATYPDNFSAETETTISNCVSLASDPAVKAIVFIQAVPGTSAAIDKVRETRPDMLFIVGVPGEDPDIIASKADIVLQADELAMGTSIVEQAGLVGAKDIVHYSFPRHMSYALLAARRDLLKANSAAAGINFVEATAPDPTGEAGVAGAQQFILEDVPRKVAELGPDTVFFSTNCSMQEPLIKKIMDEKAIMVQQCCPSPYHAYPAALNISIPDDKQGDVEFIIDQIGKKVEEGGNSGRMGTWPVPINMLMIEAGVEYARKFAEGQTNGRVDDAVLRQMIDDAAGGPGTTTVTTYDEDGKALPNFYMILCDYIVF